MNKNVNACGMKMLKNYYCRCEYAKHFFCLILLAMQRATHVTMLNWWNCISHRYCCIVIFRVSDARWNYHPTFFIYGLFLHSRKKEIHQQRTALNDDRRIQWLAPVRATEWLHIVKGDLEWCIFRFNEYFSTLFTCRRVWQFSQNKFWIMLFKTLFSAALDCWKLNNEKCMRFNTFNEWKNYSALLFLTVLIFPYGTFLFLNEPKFYSHLGYFTQSCILLSLMI